MCHFYCHSLKAQIDWMDHWTTIVTPDITEGDPTRNSPPRGGSHVIDEPTQLHFLMQHVYATIVKWFRSQRVAKQVRGSLAAHETLKVLLLCWSDRPDKYISMKEDASEIWAVCLYNRYWASLHGLPFHNRFKYSTCCILCYFSKKILPNLKSCLGGLWQLCCCRFKKQN